MKLALPKELHAYDHEQSSKANRVLSADFFARSAVTVAQELIGAYLVRQHGVFFVRLCITEVEAYDGPDDRACHGRFGQTNRTTVMFGPAGKIYVYFIYGMYWMLNIVCDQPGYPAAVLIRGVDGISGPGRLTKQLHIDKTLNDKPLNHETGLWVEAREATDAYSVIATPRIGIDYAGNEWANKPYRFVLQK